jgi:hypothetical protein
VWHHLVASCGSSHLFNVLVEDGMYIMGLLLPVLAICMPYS